jgi:hypothetical protein
VTAPVVLSHLPGSSFTLKVIAITTSGRRLITQQFYANCHKPAPAACVRTARLIVRVPPAPGSRVVTVGVYVNGHRAKVVRAHNITQIVLESLPHGRFTVTLVTRSARGKRATKTQTFVGCPASTKHNSS